jgi:hypothetical protein
MLGYREVGHELAGKGGALVWLGQVRQDKDKGAL